ncbi:hypothetical protein WJ542_18685 [Paraburkholderia sp. B3]|uniref:hypothetical protein n=1 Tax=Paraburkholderia sp. B3 TaxID=3134791 RepID=UPI003981D5B6
MKTRLALMAACVAAATGGMPGTVHARPPTPAQQQAHQSMLNDADASAQSGTDMSYGGVPDTSGQSGARLRTGKMCWPRSQCEAPSGQ